MLHRQPWHTAHRRLRYQPGDRVRVVRGLDPERTGEIVAVDPKHHAPYLVKINDAWYVHYPEDRLAPAPQQRDERQA